MNRRIVAVGAISLLTLVLAGCPGVGPAGGGGVDSGGAVPPSALVEATGPILGVTVAASLDDLGQPVDASFTYPADQPEMVVLVRIGEVTPGPLTFSWYRVTEAGDEALFEQTVAVEARDAAFSTGLNPGILAAGTYKVVATFAGQSDTIAWDVAEPQPGDLTAPVGTSQSAAGAAPAPGPSGKTTAVVPEPDPQDVSGPALALLIHSYNRAHLVEFLVLSAWDDAQTGLGISPISFTIQVSAAITGLSPGASREYTHAGGADAVGTDALKKDFSLDPCSLPGGSDLPGTSITVTAVPLGFEARRETDTQILGADTSPPTVQLVSDPSNGATVKEGDKIVLTAIAEELKSGGSWQTGVSKIEILVIKPSGETLLTEKYDTYKDKSCGDKSWKQTTKEFTYTVPEDVKGDLRICAFGYDFAGNIGKKCYTYYTGEHWQGTLHSESTRSGILNCTEIWDMQLSFTVSADGTIQGSGTGNFVEQRDCYSTVLPDWDFSDQAQFVAFNIQGSADRNKLDLQTLMTDVQGGGFNGLLNYSLFGGDSDAPILAIPITAPGIAEGTVTITGSAGDDSTYLGIHTLELTCDNCDAPGVG